MRRGRRGVRRALHRGRALLLSPRRVRRHREWILRRLGLGRARDPHLLPFSPGFAEREARPLIDPPSVPAAEAGFMRDDDMVVGVAAGAEARAYPWWIMDNHHVANDVVGGRASVLAFCEVCSSGIVFDRAPDGRRLTFEATHLFNGAVAMSDRETRSLWAPYLARAIRGRLRGTALDLLPASHATWSAWRDGHPETTVLAGHLGTREGHGSGHTIGTAAIWNPLRATVARWDERMPSNALVFGVSLEGQQRAYPLDLLRGRGGVLNDRLGDVDVVVLLDPAPGSYAAFAFDRRVGGRVLTMQPNGAGGAIDQQTGTAWTVDGVAVSGPLAGASLSYVGGHVSEWFIWASHFPQIDVAT